MVALIITVPAAVVFSESPMIVAPVVPELTTLHIIVVFEAFAGLTVPKSIKGVIAVAVVGTLVISVTDITVGGGGGAGGRYRNMLPYSLIM